MLSNIFFNHRCLDGHKKEREKDAFRDIGLCYSTLGSQANSRVPASLTLSKVLHLAEPQYRHL